MTYVNKNLSITSEKCNRTTLQNAHLFHLNMQQTAKYKALTTLSLTFCAPNFSLYLQVKKRYTQGDSVT